jgi:hypothetical protein
MTAMNSDTFEVTFANRDGPPTRKFQTFDDAKEAALRILRIYDRNGTRAAHPATIYGPDCGPKGKTIT